MSEQKYLSELHREHGEWKKNLEFVRDEIKTFKNRLEEVASQNSKTEVMAKLEQFQNQFIRHEEVIDELVHDVNAEEHKIVENAKANNVATDHRKADENEELVGRINRFDKIYQDLKSDFNRYLTEVL
jgi:predicted  nucleic acid-binding Zn-ribbon protein